MRSHGPFLAACVVCTRWSIGIGVVDRKSKLKPRERSQNEGHRTQALAYLRCATTVSSYEHIFLLGESLDR